MSGAMVVGLTLVPISPLGITFVGIACRSVAILGSVIVTVPLLRIFRTDRPILPEAVPSDRSG
ncbi:hypothetical protein [Pseudonocardia sp. GCM10023141]|uniref:hypothetical protein n=1 Tax=Pseudonocardia sp. GCM10023141 TaxID=3252653 RepID=UPI00361B8590